MIFNVPVYKIKGKELVNEPVGNIMISPTNRLSTYVAYAENIPVFNCERKDFTFIMESLGINDEVKDLETHLNEYGEALVVFTDEISIKNLSSALEFYKYRKHFKESKLYREAKKMFHHKTLIKE